MTSFSWRAVSILHRYLGIALGLVILMWFGSGMVMMYVGFPEPSERERLDTLAPIAWATCCRVGDGLVADDEQFRRAEVENILGTPVLRLSRVLLPDLVIDLAAGAEKSIETADAQAIALDTARRLGASAVLAADEIEEDQWTVGRYQADQPLFRFAFDDPRRSTLYVSGANGRVVLRTTGTQRFWNWLGAIPHWFYFTALRSDGELWSRTVIWASLLGAVLAALGLYLGFAQLGRGKRLSPYRGLFYWHHVAGIAFGITTLGFVASGLVSMNPWGFLESRGGGERARIEGAPLRFGGIRTSLEALRLRAPEAISLASAPLDGKLFWIARDKATTVRLDEAGNPAPLGHDQLAAAAQRLAGANGVAEQGLLGAEDAYYFAPHDPAALPVYRVIANDSASIRYYLDPVSSALLRRVDAHARWHRWLFAAMHRLDFAAALRARPAWDAIMLTLVLGGIAASATGVYLALRRIRSDLAWLWSIAAAAGGRDVTTAPGGGARPHGRNTPGAFLN